MSALTARELLVLRMVVRGCGYKCVASKLDVTGRTIEHSIRGIKKKLGAESLAQLGWLARDELEPGRIKDDNFVHSWHLLTPHVRELITQIVTEFDMVGMRSQHLIDKIKQLQSQQLTKEDSHGQSKETKGTRAETRQAIPDLRPQEQQSHGCEDEHQHRDGSCASKV